MADVVVKPAKPTKPRGLACSICGCRDLPVYYTRERNGSILRVRQCRHCGKKIVTHER